MIRSIIGFIALIVNFYLLLTISWSNPLSYLVALILFLSGSAFVCARYERKPSVDLQRIYYVPRKK